MSKELSKKEEDNFKSFTAPKVESKPLNAIKSEIRASGHCDKCRKRYYDVPVIDGVPQCTNCTKL